MLDFSDILWILLIAFAIWLWSDGLRARERAIRVARRACEAADVQLLDDTVALARIRPARNGEGRMTLARLYRFEFSMMGDERRSGYVAMLGARVDHAQLDLSDGTVYHPYRH